VWTTDTNNSPFKLIQTQKNILLKTYLKIKCCPTLVLEAEEKKNILPRTTKEGV
jgi:hypothetical protein